jgi:hypothetical protein
MLLRKNAYSNSGQQRNILHDDYEANVSKYLYRVKEKLMMEATL